MFDGAGRGEVADVGVVGALLVVDLLHQLRNQEVQVGVALSVAVARQVQRDAAEERREVGAVIEIEAAQEVLVGLSGSAVLRRDQAGNRFEHLGGAQQRAALDLRIPDGTLARRVRDADEIVGAISHDDLLHAGRRLTGLLRALRRIRGRVLGSREAGHDDGQQRCRDR